MWAKLKAIFDGLDETPTEDQLDQRKRLACAALMIEVATVDNDFDPRELDALRKQLQISFELDDDTAQTLCDEALTERHDATSLHQFTRLVNEHCDPQEKFDLVVGMWRVAFADDDLDKYEEHIIRRASELIYVSHSDFIRAKLEARS
jgi:uncharacterized tellurite resistance protein B-like protein